MDIGILKILNKFLGSASLKIRYYTCWTLSNIIYSNELIAAQVFGFEDLMDKILKIIVIDEELVRN